MEMMREPDPTATFQDLPPDIAEVIIKFTGSAILQVAQVNRQFRDIAATSNAAWRDACAEFRIWPLSPLEPPEIDRNRRLAAFVDSFVNAGQEIPYRDVFFTSKRLKEREKRKKQRVFAVYSQKLRVLWLAKICFAAAAAFILGFAVLVPLKFDSFIAISWVSVFSLLFAMAGCCVIMGGFVVIYCQRSIRHDIVRQKYYGGRKRKMVEVLRLVSAGWILLSIIMTLLLLFLALYAVKLDGDASRSWPAVYGPLWALISIPTVVGVIMLPPLFCSPKDRKYKSTTFALWGVVMAVFIYSVFVPLKLEGTLWWYWWQVHLPIFSANVFWIPLLITMIRSEKHRSLFVALVTVSWFCVNLTMILQSLKSDGVLVTPWSTPLFVPLWLALVIVLSFVCSQAFLLKEL
eukprot:TRINITY_DN9077_c0_g1_i1.p1 TRINITY_DN9077_c0_g1~~TRINITY_DN9077_c0_g1_i1.p1  ORF type:complete len:404 (-),score=58.96 TRINITY_DN9077_c0_g1_i1:75-1286(-)